jgi:hypothetical protein
MMQLLKVLIKDGMVGLLEVENFNLVLVNRFCNFLQNEIAYFEKPDGQAGVTTLQAVVPNYRNEGLVN